MRPFLLATLFLAGSGMAQPAEPHTVHLKWEAAQARAIDHPKAECPPIAKIANVRGTVLIDIQVDADGKVSTTKVIAGHPMLVSGALDAIRRWTFQPSRAHGEPAVMETTAEFAPCGAIDYAYESEMKVRNQQMEAARKCRAEIQANDLSSAEGRCQKALELAHRVHGNTYLYESNAWQDLGRLRLKQQRPNDALPLFESALNVLEENQQPDEAEIGYAVAWIGIAKRALTDDAGALPYFERAEKILSARIADASIEEMKQNYARQLKAVREQHAGALDKLGRASEADAIRRLGSE
jgi:TonB family protein